MTYPKILGDQITYICIGLYLPNNTITITIIVLKKTWFD